MEKETSLQKKERQAATMDSLAPMRAGCALPEGVPEVRVFSATTRRCTDRVNDHAKKSSLISSASFAPVTDAISAVERIALSGLDAAGYGEEDKADVRLLLDCLREEMAAVFARR